MAITIQQISPVAHLPSEFEQHQIRAFRQSLGLDHPLVPVDLVTKERNPRRSAASAG
jgi:hypothetical protein